MMKRIKKLQSQNQRVGKIVYNVLQYISTRPQNISLPAIHAVAYPEIPAQMLPAFLLSNGPDFKFLPCKHNPLQIPKRRNQEVSQWGS
jgi:hypothetical protein